MKAAKLLLAVFGLVLLQVAYGQKPAVVTSNEPGWHKIGEITASFDMDTESIVVLGADEFEAIRLKVTDAPMNIDRIQVHYETGEIEDIDVKNELQAGAETRSIELEHADRDIEKVSFTYQTSANYNGDNAHVELYGLKSERSGNDNNRFREDSDTTDEVLRDMDQAAEQRIDEETDDAGRGIDREADDDDRTGEEIKDGFNKSTAIIGAEIKDKVYADKMGPDGETIYIDEHSKYYYIDKDGSKVFITKLEMKNKPKDDDN